MLPPRGTSSPCPRGSRLVRPGGSHARPEVMTVVSRTRAERRRAGSRIAEVRRARHCPPRAARGRAAGRPVAETATCGRRATRSRSSVEVVSKPLTDEDVGDVARSPKRASAVSVRRAPAAAAITRPPTSPTRRASQPRPPARAQLGAEAEHDRGHLRLPAQRRAAPRPRPRHAAVAHVDDASRGLGHPLVVRHEQDRLAARVQRRNSSSTSCAALGVERARRLVGEQQRRLVGERPRDREPLALAAGEQRRGARAPCRRARAGRAGSCARVSAWRARRPRSPPAARRSRARSSPRAG